MSSINNIFLERKKQKQQFRRMIYTGSLIGCCFLAFFAVLDLFIFQLYIDGVAEFLGSVVLFFIAYMEKRSPVKTWVIVFGLLVVALVIGIGVLGNPSSDGIIIWISLLPFLCFFLLGEKQGFKVSVFICLMYLLALIVTHIHFPEQGFSLAGILAAAGTLFCASGLAMAYEKNRTQMVNLLAKQAKTDPLTSLLNRRGFTDAFNLTVLLPKKAKYHFCLFIIDLDNFKSINDKFGHDVGDIVIIECAKTIKLNLRGVDSINSAARLGGEEFIGLLPNTSLLEAEVLLNKMRVSIEQLNIESGNNNINVTASIGVTSASSTRNTFVSLYKAADEALYLAKNNGRNAVVLKE